LDFEHWIFKKNNQSQALQKTCWETPKASRTLWAMLEGFCIHFGKCTTNLRGWGAFPSVYLDVFIGFLTMKIQQKELSANRKQGKLLGTLSESQHLEHSY
jgi:hypothetical protein